MYEIYTINENDTIDSISQDYGIDKELIYRLNGLNNDYRAYPNNQLVLPRIKNQIFKYYTVKENDTIDSIALSNNMDSNTILKLNGLESDDYIYKEQTILLPRNSNTIYITKEGDTLNSVKDDLKTSMEFILKENNNIYLQPDQIIVYETIE